MKMRLASFALVIAMLVVLPSGSFALFWEADDGNLFIGTRAGTDMADVYTWGESTWTKVGDNLDDFDILADLVYPLNDNVGIFGFCTFDNNLVAVGGGPSSGAVDANFWFTLTALPAEWTTMPVAKGAGILRDCIEAPEGVLDNNLFVVGTLGIYAYDGKVTNLLLPSISANDASLQIFDGNLWRFYQDANYWDGSVWTTAIGYPGGFKYDSEIFNDEMYITSGSNVYKWSGVSFDDFGKPTGGADDVWQIIGCDDNLYVLASETPVFGIYTSDGDGNRWHTAVTSTCWDLGITDSRTDLACLNDQLYFQISGGGGPAPDINDANVWRYDGNPEECTNVGGKLELGLHNFFSAMGVFIDKGVIASFDSTQKQEVVNDNTVINVDLNDTSEPYQVTMTAWQWFLSGERFSTDQNTSMDFNYAGNYQIGLRAFGTALDGNVFYDDANETITVVTGHIGIYIADENIMANYADMNVVINGVGYTTSNGFISLDLNDIQDFNVYIYNDANDYHARTFNFPDVNQFSNLDINILMLEDVNGQTIDFQFYEADTVTLLANTFVSVWKDDNYVGIAQTDGQGLVSFFLNTDTNYYFTATDSAGDFIRYDSVEVTSLIPKDELTLALITPYDFAVKRLADRQDLNLTADFVTYILPDTLDYYIFDYNGGPNYYDRQYEVKVIGNPLTATIQPYLVPKAFSGDFIFNVIDADLRTPLGGVRIVVIRTIPGEGTVEIASMTTDDAGKANIALLLDTEYNINFYYAGELVHQVLIRPTAASLFYQAEIDLTEVDPSYIPIGRLTVVFSPTTSYLPLNSDGTVDINVSITLTNKSIAAITTRVLDSNGCVYDSNNFTTPWTDGNTVYYHPDLNGPASTNRYNGLPCIFSDQYGLYVEVDVNSVDGNTFKVTSIHYNVTATWQFGLWYGLGLLAGEINTDGGYVGTSFLAFFITMIAVGALAVAGVHNPALLIFLMDVLMGLFFYFGWITDMIFIFFIATGLLLLGLTRAVFN